MKRFGRRKERRPRDDEGRMTLREHILELRNRLLISVAAVAATTILAWFVYDQALEILMRPFHIAVRPYAAERDLDPQMTMANVGDALLFQIKVSAMLGLTLAAPIWLYQLWAFIAPGLHRSEKKWAMLFAAIATPLFAGGIAVAYWTLPKGIEILLGFTPESVQNLVELPKYLNFVIQMLLVFGIAFLIPLVVILLNLLGIVPAAALGKFRPYIVLVIFVFAAVATPSGDPFTLFALAIPMSVLFFAAEVICRIIDKRRARRDEELAAA